MLAFGATCTSDSDCASGACHQSDAGGPSFCTITCDVRSDRTSDCDVFGANWRCADDGAPEPECVCAFRSSDELCGDGADDDCDGIVDEGCAACDPECTGGARCVEGTCVCPEGHAVCDGACVDLANDSSHCGACGNACSAGGARCVEGTCVCPEGHAVCDGACVDLAINSSSCGGCGNECPSNAWCEAGTCRCETPGEVACGLDCALLESSTAHCGACDNACSVGATCEGGTCACPAGQVACDGRCVDLSSDVLACGACGNACLPGATCEAGACACSPERTVCADECADLGSSERNCGACGTTCEHLCLDAQCDEPVEIVGMWQHACARTASGRVACWGTNQYGQVGADTGIVPRVVALPLPATAIAAGYRSTCALLTDRSVWCWGSNDVAQLGRDAWPSGERHPPGAVSGIDDAIGITAGGTFNCALREGGTVACWGSSWEGELGPELGAVPRPRAMPVTGAVRLTGGRGHACALLEDRTVSCWGANDSGQLGRGFYSPNETASPVPGLTDVVALDAGYATTCAVVADGRVYCWGDNHFGQIGQAPPSPFPAPDVASPSPREVSAITNAIAVAAAITHTCILLAVGRGGGRGPLGDVGSAETTGESTTAMPAVRDVDHLGASYYNTFALSRGTLWVWGMNQYGQLMLPPGEARATPVRASWTP